MSEISLQALCDYLSDLLQVEDFVDYCPNGLQVEGKQTISSIATAVSASVATIEKAVEEGVDALIVHHGMFWKGDSYPICGVKKKKILPLLQKEVSLLGYHLPLDAHRSLGNNWKAAFDLGWKDLEACINMQGQEIGVMGRFSSMPREEFQKLLEKYYGQNAHVALGGKEIVASACLVSGGAYKCIPEAANLGVDCFITGNFDEPAWHDAFEKEVNFFACGHSATERVGPKALGEHIQGQFNIPCKFIDIYNPF